MTTATPTRTPKSRKPEPRTAHLTTIGNVRVLWLTVGKLTTAYRLEVIPSDFGTAYRLSKADNGQGEPEVYNVCLQDAGRSTCECKGHLRWRTECKHIAALWQLSKRGLLPVPAVKPQPAEEPSELDDF
jgi:hypothetical protein